MEKHDCSVQIKVTTFFMKLISGLKQFIILLDPLMVLKMLYDLKLNVNIP